MLTHQRVLSVSQLTEYLKGLLEKDFRLSNLWLRGEVSNVSKPRSGHLYLSLKDKEALIAAVMFKSNYTNLPFDVNNGLEVMVRGRVGIYPKGGLYQFYIQEMFPKGIGPLELALQQTKEKLTREGLFDLKHKKALPKIPRSIAILTSPTGAVIQDFVKVVNKRYPAVDIYLVPIAVQGEKAPIEIVKAIQFVNRQHLSDVLVLARGGGSLEELWAFNTEEVARTVFASVVPVVSAIGHETDYTITDMVADYRAATPSIAGEKVVPSLSQFLLDLSQINRQLVGLGKRFLLGKQEGLKFLDYSLRLKAEAFLEQKENMFNNLSSQLHALSPLRVLSRGYSITEKESGKVVFDSENVEIDEKVRIILHKGFLICKVEKKGEGGYGE